MEERGRKAIYVHCDASHEADNEAMAEAAVDAFGQIDICVARQGFPTLSM